MPRYKNALKEIERQVNQNLSNLQLTKYSDLISVKENIVGQSTNIVVSCKAPLYNIIYGRLPGKMPPYKPISDWVFDKNIQPYTRSTTKKGKLKYISEELLIYLIRRGIGNNGTKGRGELTLDREKLKELYKLDVYYGITGYTPIRQRI